MAGALSAVVVAGPVSAGPTDGVAPLPPRQPTTGPAGSNYPYPGEPFHSGVDGVGGYALYEPNPLPSGPVPVVLLVRGACPTECSQDDTNNIINAWRGHLVRKGNIVVFPHYQNANGDDPAAEEERIVGALRSALLQLQQPGHATPDLTRFGIAGHSRGSQMALNVASIVSADNSAGGSLGLPQPSWVLAVEPGLTSRIRLAGAAPSSRPGTLADLPATARLVVVVGDKDSLAREVKARQVWAATGHVANRSYVYVRSDRRGAWAVAATPVEPACSTMEQRTSQSWAVLAACVSTNMAWTMLPRYSVVRDVKSPAATTGDLTADHFFPGTGNALDMWVVWKFSQALVECTGGVAGSCDYAFGGTAEQRDMGAWSDGRPVRRPCVATNPPSTWDAVACGD